MASKLFLSEKDGKNCEREISIVDIDKMLLSSEKEDTVKADYKADIKAEPIPTEVKWTDVKMTEMDNEGDLKTDRALLDIEKGQKHVTFSDL